MKGKGELTFSHFFMLGFGSMVGVGWAVSSNRWLAQSGGVVAAFIGFIIGTILLLPIGLSHSSLMKRLPVSGGVMVYGYRAFGTGVSFIGSWFVALAYLTILPWEAIYINNILINLFPVLKMGQPIYHVLGSPVYLSGAILGLVFALGLLFINLKGSKLAGKLQTLLSYLIILAGVIVILASFIQFDLDNIRPLYENIGVGSHKNMASGILTMIVLVPFFMAGFDTIPQSIEERSPKTSQKTVSKALVGSIAAAGLFYAFIILSTGGASPWQAYSKEASPAMATMLKNLYQGKLGNVLYWIIMIGTLAGLFSTWNGMFMAAVRLLDSMGESGLLPSFFAKKGKNGRIPLGATIFCFLAAAIGPLIGFNIIDSLTSLGSVAFVLGWFIACLSALKIERKSRDPLTKSTVASVIISALILALTFIPGQAAYMGKLSLILFIIWMALGMLFYYFTNHGSRGISEEERRMKLFGSVKLPPLDLKE